MEFFVNGSRLDVEIEDEKTVGDVIKSFETKCINLNVAPVKIVVNGWNIFTCKTDSILSQKLDDKTKIEFEIISQIAIENSFVKERKMACKIAKDIKELSTKLQNGKDTEAKVNIIELADLIEKVCHTASLSVLFPERFGSMKINGKSFQEFFSDLSPICSSFEHAINTKDIAMMGNIAENEISPRLELFADALNNF